MAAGTVLFTAAEIERRVAELAAAIDRDFAGRRLTIVAVLRGSVVFLDDLLARLEHPATVELVEASSYGDGTNSRGRVTLRRYGSLEVAGRRVLLVDDIADTGRTLLAVRRELERMGARSVSTCVLLDKPCRREVELEVDYRGFQVSDAFVVGYGLDHADRYRDLPYIARLDEPAAEGGGT
ncbi:MAG: hypoxanthine phosphoribosyltransferase [Candidatus Brocadiia bacterium]